MKFFSHMVRAMSIVLIGISFSIQAQTARIFVEATGETEPVPSAGDAADDACIWVNRANPEDSRIIATDKLSGICVYSLDGKMIQHLPVGEVNNVDLRSGIVVNGQSRTIVVAGNRKLRTLEVFLVDPETGTLEHRNASKLKLGMAVYGLCLYKSNVSDKLYVFITSKSGLVGQFELQIGPDGDLAVQLVREIQLPSQAEGCVADDANGVVYISEEAEGIHKFDAEPDASSEGVCIAEIIDFASMRKDIEGLALYLDGDDGYLVASSQGNDMFVVFERAAPHDFVGSFYVVGTDTIDHTTRTDGIAISSSPIGPTYPSGLMVVQDDDNNYEFENQNFKLVSWETVKTSFMDKKKKQ